MGLASQRPASERRAQDRVLLRQEPPRSQQSPQLTMRKLCNTQALDQALRRAADVVAWNGSPMKITFGPNHSTNMLDNFLTIGCNPFAVSLTCVISMLDPNAFFVIEARMPVIESTMRNAGAMTGMRIRNDGAAVAQSSAWTQAAGCKYSRREGSLEITAS